MQLAQAICDQTDKVWRVVVRIWCDVWMWVVDVEPDVNLPASCRWTPSSAYLDSLPSSSHARGLRSLVGEPQVALNCDLDALQTPLVGALTTSLSSSPDELLPAAFLPWKHPPSHVGAPVPPQPVRKVQFSRRRWRAHQYVTDPFSELVLPRYRSD